MPLSSSALVTINGAPLKKKSKASAAIRVSDLSVFVLKLDKISSRRTP